MTKTIAAIATPLGEGGIGVIRLSGKEAIAIASTMISSNRMVSSLKGYEALYGRVYDYQGEIDEAIVLVFREPHSYTGEDVVEISIHGGKYLLQRVLKACCEHGAVPAEAGEFTKRAFLNGKMDLTQAESVMDLIAAQGKQSARAALAARDGALFCKTKKVVSSLITESASLAAWIDYPEEEIEETQRTSLEKTLETASKTLEQLLSTYGAGSVFREGIETVIVGRPNVGKSTLMNLLADSERSIVTKVAGTTRDVVTETVQVGDLLLKLSDTAGIRDTDDIIEQVGVARSEAALEKAQLILAVFDGSTRLNKNDWRILEGCKNAMAIAIINKQDLPQQIEREILENAFPYLVELSAKSGEGGKKLEGVIEKLFSLERFDASGAVIANERQRAAVQEAMNAVDEGLQAVRIGVSLDAVGVCMETAEDALLALTGQKAGPAVVNEIFSRFCVGK